MALTRCAQTIHQYRRYYEDLLRFRNRPVDVSRQLHDPEARAFGRAGQGNHRRGCGELPQPQPQGVDRRDGEQVRRQGGDSHQGPERGSRERRPPSGDGCERPAPPRRAARIHDGRGEQREVQLRTLHCLRVVREKHL